MTVNKIVVIGPESTGKSTLCEQLAAYYRTEWCPEFARAYLLEHGRDYRFGDLLRIAQGQIVLEEEKLASLTAKHETGKTEPGVLFIDTDMYVMKVWCEFVFENCHTWILDQIVRRQYDLYLLCNTDLPWVADALREYPDFETREKLFHIYKDIMVNQQTPWVEISGDYSQRLSIAVKAVDRLLEKNKRLSLE